MRKNSFLKIWLLSINFEIFYLYNQITALKTPDCMCLVALLVHRDEYLKVNRQQPNFHC